MSSFYINSIYESDCAAMNIMMDGAPLYPQGFHPLRRDYSRDVIHALKPAHRIDHPVRYYFIDYGLSSIFQESELPLVTGGKGRDQEVPELAFDVPYNAYKVDICILGNLYRREFIEVRYQNTISFFYIHNHFSYIMISIFLYHLQIS